MNLTSHLYFLHMFYVILQELRGYFLTSVISVWRTPLFLGFVLCRKKPCALFGVGMGIVEVPYRGIPPYSPSQLLSWSSALRLLQFCGRRFVPGVRSDVIRDIKKTYVLIGVQLLNEDVSKLTDISGRGR